MATKKFLDIAGIDDSELIHIGATLVYKLGEVDNFKGYMSLYFQKNYLPFIKDIEELYMYITLIGEIYISSIMQRDKPKTITGLRSVSDSQKKIKLVTNDNLLILGKICLIFSSLGMLNYEFKDAPIIIKAAHKKFNLKKRKMISVAAEIHSFSYMVYRQLDSVGMIIHEEKPDES